MASWLPTFLLIIVAVATPIIGSDPRKLDEVPGSPEIKCTTCPVCNTCDQSPPPPSPSPPPPPPPSPPLPPPPPPDTPETPSLNCPPPPPSMIPKPNGPPSPSYIPIPVYGPPGNLYPVSPYISGCARRSLMIELQYLVGCGLLGLVAFW